MLSPNARSAALLLGALMLTRGGFAPAAGSADGAPMILLSDALTLRQTGARNPTVAVDERSGTAYIAWAQEVPGAATARRSDPRLEVLLSRSDDGGRHFGLPRVVNVPKDQVTSSAVSPPRVQVGPNGEVYVQYSHEDPDFKLLGMHIRDLLRLVRSEDGARTFADSVEIGTQAIEGVATSLGMTNLFVAPDGALYVSWLDTRETFAYIAAHHKFPSQRDYSSQLRVARSVDGGRSFARSTLAAKPVCVCCGTKVAQGVAGPLYASTRGLSWSEAKGSADPVRDIIVASSRDRGATWSDAVKIHDDRFKVSTCPDVTPGLSVDSQGRLHAAWYTGSERRPGVFYAVSADQGKTFAEPLTLLTDEWVPYGDVKLALDARDNAWVAFEDKRGDTNLIHLVRIGADGSVTRAESWPGTSPDLAALGDSVVVTWDGITPEGEEQGGSILTRLARMGAPR